MQVRTLQIEIENDACKRFRLFFNGESDLQAALALSEYDRRDRTKPDSLTVRLSLMESEKYLPPRCRQARTRLIYTTLAEYTLGELRTAAGDESHREEIEKESGECR